ncbi:LptF/LptG family permease [Candidatus Neomarinimicrobiota bacterium]
MKLLDRYILTRFLAILFNALLSFVVLFLVVDIVEHLDSFIDAKMPRRAVVAYYYYSLPWFVSIGLPMATLLATFFAMGMLNKRNEITAMKASGLSIKRIGTSLLIVGLLITILSFYFDDFVVSAGMRSKAELQSQYLAREYRRKHKVVKQNIFLQHTKDEYLAIDRFDYRKDLATGVYIQTYDGGQMVKRLDFRTMSWNDKLESWQGIDYTLREFDSVSDTTLLVSSGGDTIINLTITPIDLTKMSVTPEEMRYGELKDFVNGLIRSGVEPTRWEVNLHFKVAFACTSFIMVLFGLPLSIGKPRSSLAFGAGMSIFVIFGYYVVIKLGQSFGFKGLLPPWPAVWLPNFIFLSLGFYLLSKTRS